jgi:hypothetical protein
MLPLLLAAVAFLAGCSRSLQGGTFASEAELLDVADDFVAIGRFDLAYPATVVSIDEAQDRLRFRRGPTPHEYSGFDGYTLRAVHLDCGGKAGVLVLRSKQKRPEASTPASPR